MQVGHENQCLFHGMVSSRADRTEFSTSWHAPLFETKLSCHKHAGVPCFGLEFACCHFWTDSFCSKSDGVSVLTCVWTLERKPLKGKKHLPLFYLTVWQGCGYFLWALIYVKFPSGYLLSGCRHLDRWFIWSQMLLPKQDIVHGR